MKNIFDERIDEEKEQEVTGNARKLSIEQIETTSEANERNQMSVLIFIFFQLNNFQIKGLEITVDREPKAQ